VDQALPELALLIPQQLARGRLVDRREVRREVAQPVTAQDVIDSDERTELALGRGAQEGRQPDQRPRPRIASAKVVETRQVVGRRVARSRRTKSSRWTRSGMSISSRISGMQEPSAREPTRRRR